MTELPKELLDLLKSYVDGPRIWDASSILPKVYVLENKGLIERDGNRGAYRLTDLGRMELDIETGTISWREARALLTGEEGDGLYGVNAAQQILESLAAFPETKAYYRLEHDAGYLYYAGRDADSQPRYKREPPL